MNLEPSFIFGNSEERLDDDELEHGFVIDVQLKLIKLYYLNAYPGEPMVSEPVPEGVDMFNILNITVPSNVSSLNGWSVVISPNSSYYPKLQHFFGNMHQLLYHLETPRIASITLLCIYIPIMILGISANMLNLFVILSTKKLRTDPRNVFIVFLALSDFFLCAFTSPLTLWYTLVGHWPLGENSLYLCKFVKTAQDFPIFMSSFCIGAIACDRFWFIVMSQRKQMNAKQAFMISLFLVLLSSGFVVPVFFASKLAKVEYLTDRLICEVETDPDSTWQHSYTIITNFCHFFTILAIVICLYAAIYYRLRLRPPSHNAEVNRRRRRTNIFLALITIIFFVCWTPLVLYSHIFDYFRHLLPDRHSMITVGYAYTLVFGLLTAIFNPILYTSLNEGFKEAFVAKFPCCACILCCRKFRLRQKQHRRRRNENNPTRADLETASLSPDNGNGIEMQRIELRDEMAAANGEKVLITHL